jgi:hypothetical protein
MFAEVTVVVDGALEAEERFRDEIAMRQFIMDIESDAEGDGVRTEVFVLYHGHDLDVDDCACIQYELDHRPKYIFNGDGDLGVWQ